MEFKNHEGNVLETKEGYGEGLRSTAIKQRELLEEGGQVPKSYIQGEGV